MKISELIEYLEETKKENGDIEVKIKYRDDGGEWPGYDEYLYTYVNEEDGKKICVL